MSQAGGLPFQLPQSYNFRVLMEPKGFIRLIEFVIAIFAFATCGGYSSVGELLVQCPGASAAQVASFGVAYPFRLVEQVAVKADVCNATSATTHAVIGSEGSSQFFVFIGVWSFLTCIATCILYVAFEELTQIMHWIPQGDFLHALAIAFMWLVASAAWAQGLVDVKAQTDVAKIMSRQRTCMATPNACRVVRYVDYSSLNVSVIFGFLCMAVWAGNLWFLFKETKWFKVREQQQQQQIGGFGAAPGEAGIPQSAAAGPSTTAGGGASGRGAPTGLPSYPTSSPFAPPSDPAFMQQ